PTPGPPPARPPATTQRRRERGNAHNAPPDKQGRGGPAAMTAGCQSTRTSHAPGAAEFIRARTRWDPPRTHGPMLPGAAVQTANGPLSLVEQTKRFAI